MKRDLVILVYKKTHPGDPDGGVFGVEDCMGRVRGWRYDAIVGVGGIGREAQSHGIDGKLDWVGIEPKRWPDTAKRGPLVSFQHIRDFDGNGPLFADLAPRVARRLFSCNARVVKKFSPVERAELQRVLAIAKNGFSSHARARTAATRKRPCPRRCIRRD